MLQTNSLVQVYDADVAAVMHDLLEQVVTCALKHQSTPTSPSPVLFEDAIAQSRGTGELD